MSEFQRTLLQVLAETSHRAQPLVILKTLFEVEMVLEVALIRFVFG